MSPELRVRLMALAVSLELQMALLADAESHALGAEAEGLLRARWRLTQIQGWIARVAKP